MTDEILHIEPGFRTIDGELINAMIDAIVATGVSTVSVVTANGISGTVANPTTTPAITLTLGDITPTSIAASGTITGSNLSGTNTGNQTIILTGDITGSGTGSFAATIANNAVTLAKMAQMATASFLGRNTASIGDVEVLSAATVKTMLNLAGNNSGDITLSGENYISLSGQALTANAVNLAGSNVTGTLPAANYPTFIGDSGSGGTKGAVPAPAIGDASKFMRGDATWQTINGGTVTTVSVVTANGISGSVANPTTTPALTLTLGSINPSAIGATTPASIQGFCPTNYQTGTSYTSVLGDSGKRVSLTNASAITITVPASGSVAYPAETEIIIRQGGAGQVTVAAAGGVTINSLGGALNLSGQYAYATLKLSSTADTWDLFGAITT